MRLRFRRVDHRAGVLVRGPAGWGEFSPFPEYAPDYTSRWLAAAREAATVAWPAPRRSSIPVNVTVPAVDPSTASALVRDSGCRTAKVKVAEPGQTLADDVARVTAVREALGPDGSIRVDANGAWDVASASLAITRLAPLGLEYVEQPVATLEEMRDLRGRVTVPLAADESVRTAEDPLRIADLDAADVLVLKVQPLGGVHRALEIADAAGLPVVVSSALETSVGLAAGLAFAAALPELPYACGLATASLLAGDVVLDTLAPEGGAIAVRRPLPDPALLTTWAPGPEDAAELLQRLADADAAAGSFR
ncbi:MAG: o-succinylbenzoate synthase [Actinobacteria bacterium]|nr:o-succinylbenzoate synthase [Actinomycetota bacterium]